MITEDSGRKWFPLRVRGCKKVADEPGGNLERAMQPLGFRSLHLHPAQVLERLPHNLSPFCDLAEDRRERAVKCVTHPHCPLAPLICFLSLDHCFSTQHSYSQCAPFCCRVELSCVDGHAGWIVHSPADELLGLWTLACGYLSAFLVLSVIITGSRALGPTPQPFIGSVNRWSVGSLGGLSSTRVTSPH